VKTEFKAFLASKALNEGLSVSELVQRRGEGKPSKDEAVLLALAEELQIAVKSAKASLASAMAAVNDALNEAKLTGG